MYISLDWINEYVDLSGLSPEVIADRLTMKTAEVEGYETLHRSIKGVLVGQVIKAEKIGENGKKTLATVDCGSAGQFITVCAAPNCRIGLKAAFAPVGVTLSDGSVVKETVVAGYSSSGLLCSARELGMSHWHEIVLECPSDIPNGTLLNTLIPEEDILIEIDNKSITHRPDLWGHYGFAREFAAIFGRDLKPMKFLDLKEFSSLPSIPVKIENYQLCPCYGCISFEMPSIPCSPLKMQRRLHALGQRTYDLMVDVTNYVMLELGQPTHAFNGDKVHEIRVAQMGKAGEFTTLDGQIRKMIPDDLLIWNEHEPVALAGVMGGLNSEVTSGTKRILLECANFQAARIRRTATRLDLRSDASQRYEKSQPPVNTQIAAARILKIIRDSGAELNVTSSYSYEGDLKDAFRSLTLTSGQLERMAGITLPDEEVIHILESLGFKAKYAPDRSLQVEIPPFRSEKDISIPADITEEVLRIYGYDHIQPKMPDQPLSPLYYDREIRIEHKARRLLSVGHQFIEVQNYSWLDDWWDAQLGFTPESPMEVRNPMTQNNRFLRTTLIPNLLQLIGKNRVHRDTFRLFEFGHVYHERPLDDTAKKDAGKCRPCACCERTHLGGVSYATAAQGALEDHYRAIKGTLEDLSRLLGGEPLTFTAGADGDSGKFPWKQDGYWVEIHQGKNSVGAMGVLDGKFLQTVVPEGGQVIWFELEYYKLDAEIFPIPRFKPLPVYPGSWQDFSLVWDINAGYASLAEKLERFTHPLLKSREFLYCYKGKGLEKHQGSYTFRLWLSADHTMSGEEIDGFRSAWLAFLESEGLSLRM